MKAVWKAGVWAWATVTPDGMFCVADTPAPLTVVTALATEMPGYVAAKDAVKAAPLADSALDTVVVVTTADVGTAVGAAVGVAVGLGTLQPEVTLEMKLPVLRLTGKLERFVGSVGRYGVQVAIEP